MRVQVNQTPWESGELGQNPSGIPGNLGAGLQGDLLLRRVVFINGSLDGQLAARVSAELMTLDALGTQPIDIYVDSADGALDAALAVMDTIDLLRSESRTTAMGEVGGAVVGVLAVGRKRAATPNARIRLAAPKGQMSGAVGALTAHLQHQQQLLARFQERLGRSTDRPPTEIEQDLRQGRYLDAREALEYRLIDTIATPGAPRVGPAN